jgi:hypothetical protein
MDRTYWAWKFTDFPHPRFQEALCTLAFLYDSDIPNSPYRGNRHLLAWIESGLDAWLRTQHRDGSIDEAYPFERSLAATAFTTFYLSEALTFLGRALSTAVRARIVEGLGRAGNWLLGNDEHHGILSNHLAAAGAALLHLQRLSNDPRYGKRASMFLERVLARQSSEGWHEEYGGADPGYQTATCFYLAKALELGGVPGMATDLEKSLRASFAFLAHFIHPDGSIGGEYSSRGTQTGYPAAFEMWAVRDPNARWIAANLRQSLFQGRAVGLGGVDTFNAFAMLNNYVFAHRAASRGNDIPLEPVDPTPGNGVVHFPQAGLLRIRAPRYDAFIGLSKGGVIKVFDRQRQCLAMGDCGYVGRLRDGRMVASSSFGEQRRTLMEDGEVVVEGPLHAFRRPTLRTSSFLALRLISLSLGRLAVVSRWIKERLVAVLIRDRRQVDVVLSRRITWTMNEIRIQDRLKGTAGGRLENIQRTDRFTASHMGSARYFVMHELEGGPDMPEPVPGIDTGRLVEGVSLSRVVRFGDPGGA